MSTGAVSTSITPRSATVVAGAIWDRQRECWTLPDAATVAAAVADNWRFSIDSPRHSRTHCIECERKILESDLRIGYPAEDKFSSDGVRSFFLHIHCLPEELVSSDRGLARLCRERNVSGVQSWLAGHVVGFWSLTQKKKAVLAQGFCETQPAAVSMSPKRTPVEAEGEKHGALSHADIIDSQESLHMGIDPLCVDGYVSPSALIPLDAIDKDEMREASLGMPDVMNCDTTDTPVKDKGSKYLGAWRLSSEGTSSNSAPTADSEELHTITPNESRGSGYLDSWRNGAATSPRNSRHSPGVPVRLVPSHRLKGKGSGSRPYWSKGKGNSGGEVYRNISPDAVNLSGKGNCRFNRSTSWY